MFSAKVASALSYGVPIIFSCLRSFLIRLIFLMLSGVIHQILAADNFAHWLKTFVKIPDLCELIF